MRGYKEKDIPLCVVPSTSHYTSELNTYLSVYVHLNLKLVRSDQALPTKC